MKRGKIKTTESHLVALWIPSPLVVALDHGVRKTDSDRSKFIRTALREKLQKEQINTEEAA